MLNLNKIGRPLCKVEKGKYDGIIVSVSTSDALPSDDKDENLIKEFKAINSK